MRHELTLAWPHLVPSGMTECSTEANPTFSIVVAAWQAEATLHDALASALNQTYPAHEVIVCDDGSTDRTAEVAASFGAAVQLVRQGNAGEGAAKNAAAARASGDFIVCLDADDTFTPERLAAMASLWRTYPDLDILSTDAYLEVNGAIARRAYGASWPFNTSDQRREILRRNFLLSMSAVRRERWDAVGGYPMGVTRTADWEMWAELLLSGSAAGHVPVPLARYRLSAHSLSSQRLLMSEARAQTLLKLGRRGGLSQRERQINAAALRTAERDLVVGRALDALRAGDPAGRRMASSAARSASVPTALRIRLVAGAALPSVSRRWLGRRPPELGGGVRMPREAPERERAHSVAKYVSTAQLALDRAIRRWPPSRFQRWWLASHSLQSLPANALILDAGCGDGSVATRLAGRHPTARVIAMDLSSWAVKEAKSSNERSMRRRVPIIVQGDMTRPPFPCVFDAVLALESLVEIPDDEAALAGFAAIIKPGGQLLLHVPRAEWEPLLPGSEARWRAESRHGYEEGSLTERLTALGFAVVRIEPTQRDVVTFAQEVRDRTRHLRLALRLLLHPILTAAVPLEKRGLTRGESRGFLVCAVKL